MSLRVTISIRSSMRSCGLLMKWPPTVRKAGKEAKCALPSNKTFSPIQHAISC
jgi:hypothetical protein